MSGRYASYWNAFLFQLEILIAQAVRIEFRSYHICQRTEREVDLLKSTKC